MNTDKVNLTKKLIEDLPIPQKGKQVYYHDIKVHGLTVRVSGIGSKYFVLYRWVDNKPERSTLGRFPDLTVEQARAKAMQLNATIAQGNNPNDVARAAKAEVTLQELFGNFLEKRRNRRGAYLSEKTKRDYRNAFDIYLNDNAKGLKLANRQLSKIRDSEVANLHHKVGEHSPVTANKLLAILSSLFTYAKEKRLFKGDSPTNGIRKFAENSRDRFLQSDELPRFFAALAAEQNTTVRDYFLISLLTGARRSNVQAMRWDEISFERAEWRIPNTKNGTPHTVTLSPEAIDILMTRKAIATEPYVFPGVGVTGHLVEPKAAWKRILERAGIENLRVHDLRRTFGSWQARTGASLSIIGKSLNHKSTASTAIYARLDLDPVRQSVNTAVTAMLEAAGVQREEHR